MTSRRRIALRVRYRSRRDGRIGKRSARNIVRKQVQIFLAEIHARLEHVPAFDQRPVVTIFVRRLHLSQRVAKGILSQIFRSCRPAPENLACRNQSGSGDAPAMPSSCDTLRLARQRAHAAAFAREPN